LSEEVSEDGKQFKIDFLAALVGMFASFSVDAYTLDHHHYIAGLACFPQLGIHPLLMYLAQASNEQESYAELGAFFHGLCMFAISFYM
jgi:putative Mn2+ efflux pump MntP